MTLWHHKKPTHHIVFNCSFSEFLITLAVKTEKEEIVYEVETELLAIRKDTIVDSVKNLGFKEVELFGNFEKAPYSIESPAIVLVAKK